MIKFLSTWLLRIVGGLKAIDFEKVLIWVGHADKLKDLTGSQKREVVFEWITEKLKIPTWVANLAIELAVAYFRSR
jgi:uncharacterized membrane protein YkvA (DUF1232 family)